MSKKRKLMEPDQTVEEVNEVDVKKRKKKKCKHKYEGDENKLTGDGNTKGAEKEGPMETKKKKKKRHTEEVAEEEEDVKVNSEEMTIKSKKKKKKKQRTKSLDEDSVCEGVIDHSKHCSDINASSLENGNEAASKKSRKKKKKKKKEISENDSLAGEDIETVLNKKKSDCSEQAKPKKNKKKKNHKTKSEACEVLEQNSGEITQSQKQKSRKVSNHNNKELGDNKAPKLLEAEKKMENRSPENDTGKQNFEKISQHPVNAGQWQTAGFEDENRQEKFLRLMGGFKKGNDTNSLKSKFQLGTGGNFAMTKDQEKKYQNELENQFDKALAFRMNRGNEALGLGFQKPEGEGKRFHININQSRSIKFDD